MPLAGRCMCRSTPFAPPLDCACQLCGRTIRESRNRGCHVDCGDEGCMRCFGSYLVWPELREHFLRRLEQGPLGTHLITRRSQHNRTCLIPVSGTGTIRFRLGSLCFVNACPELYIVLSSQESRIAVTGLADSGKALALCHSAPLI